MENENGRHRRLGRVEWMEGGVKLQTTPSVRPNYCLVRRRMDSLALGIHSWILHWYCVDRLVLQSFTVLPGCR
jgi:hypothetical protein